MPKKSFGPPLSEVDREAQAVAHHAKARITSGTSTEPATREVHLAIPGGEATLTYHGLDKWILIHTEEKSRKKRAGAYDHKQIFLKEGEDFLTNHEHDGRPPAEGQKLKALNILLAMREALDKQES